MAALSAAIGARGRTLVVLDNFEQIVEAGGPLLSTWSSAAAGFRMIGS